MLETENGRNKPAALQLLASERPRNVGWLQAAGLLFGDWGTSRLYVLGLALFFAGRTSFWLILLMSLLILAVGWAYTQICRIYPDGGGVYTAAKHKSRMLAVIGGVLLFADYTVTASLSSLDAFHYFGLGQTEEVKPIAPDAPQRHTLHHGDVGIATDTFDKNLQVDAGTKLYPHRESPPSAKEKLWSLKSPAFWAILSIALIGFFNLMGPKHTGGFALGAAIGMVFITLLIAAFAIPQLNWRTLPHHIAPLGGQPYGELWVSFVSIVLALSGVEAVANLTGVMHKPVARTARRAIWVVAAEVAVFNVVLAACMLAIYPLNRDAHLADMAAFLSGYYVGMWGEWAVRIVGGLLLLSATNTALTDMISVQYLMARDGELPQWMTALNRFGVPWMPAAVAASVPILVLLISHDLDSLAALYAIGVIGAVAINVTLCSIHPRLRKWRRKIPMMMLGVVLLAIWVTLAYTKLHALIFVSIVLVIGLSARELNKLLQKKKGARSLFRQAIMEQLSESAMLKRKIMVGTYGSDAIAKPALVYAKEHDTVLVVCFIRHVSLSYKYDERSFNLDTDLGGQRTFAKFLDAAHQAGVPVIPVYDTGHDPAELFAENAAIYGCERVLIGTSRQGAIYHLIKGHFQNRLEQFLPEEIPVEVISTNTPVATPVTS